MEFDAGTKRQQKRTAIASEAPFVGEARLEPPVLARLYELFQRKQLAQLTKALCRIRRRRHALSNADAQWGRWRFRRGGLDVAARADDDCSCDYRN
jgi:hypothetical protein